MKKFFIDLWEAFKEARLEAAKAQIEYHNY
jgi:hypothetical protein